MSYYNDAFESDSVGKGSQNDERRHLLKLSIDFLAVKEMKVCGSFTVQYGLRLINVKQHQFKSTPPTAVNSNQNSETKFNGAFSSYDFQATKSEILALFSDNQLLARIIQSPQDIEVGTATVELRELLSAPLKKTPQASVRVSDQYLPIRDSQGYAQGLIRCILYLQDMGEVEGSPNAAPRAHSFAHSKSMGIENRSPNEGGAEYQAVWQLEMWKRSEEAKFKAWLKQREIDRIEEITSQWKAKESEREKSFGEAVSKVTQLESKLRLKALEMQRREERLIQLEEELKAKIAEVSRQLTVKEEEVLNVKKRFKEERTALEMDKKRLTAQCEELKNRAEAAEAKLLAFKRDIDESPLSVLRSELAQKNLLLIESESKTKQAYEERDEAKRRFENLKKDMVTLKKQLDKEQKDTLQRQAEELDKLKNDIRNKQVQEEERREINALKSQLSMLTAKLSEQSRTQGKQQPETINDRTPFNPFTANNFGSAPSNIMSAAQPAIYLDTYAKQQASPQKSSAGISMGGTELERLKQEREELIKTGCYTQDDPLIQELDRQIRATQLRLAQ